MAKRKIPPMPPGNDKREKATKWRRMAKRKGDTSISQIERLRRTIEEIRARLQSSATLRVDSIASRRDIRKTSHLRIATLGKRGTKLSGQFKRALQSTDQRDETRRLALAKIAELRAQLSRVHD